MGQKSRSKKERRESVESRRFRQHMSERWDAASVVFYAGEPVPFLRPLDRFEDHIEFDRAVCESGIKRFIRAVMPSDQPNPERLIQLGLDRDAVFGPYIEVRRLSSSLRVRRSVEVAWLREPNGLCPNPKTH
jgi:hypothetical protein